MSVVRQQTAPSDLIEAQAFQLLSEANNCRTAAALTRDPELATALRQVAVHHVAEARRLLSLVAGD